MKKTDGTWSGVKGVGAKDVVAVTPNDSTDLSVQPDGIYVGAAGDVVMTFASGDVTLPLAQGYHPYSPTRIKDTNTTASSIFALYFE
jgi:hypothetical protein